MKIVTETIDQNLESALDQFLVDLALPSKPNKVLDLGCGNGHSIEKLKKHFTHVHGLDVSPEMIAMCQKRFENQENLTFECRDVRFLSLEKNSWDAAWLNDLSGNLKPEELQRVIQSLFSGLTSKGKIAVYWVEGTGSVDDRPWGLDGPTRTTKRWIETAICSLVEQTGFQVKKIGRLLGRPDSKFLIAERIV